MIKDAGFKRISWGFRPFLLNFFLLIIEIYIKNIENVINNIKKHNLIFNLDFMYGLNGQTDEDISLAYKNHDSFFTKSNYCL
jgi:coproporphyrinogen III oxidase-like Fe-S oxidoreductase